MAQAGDRFTMPDGSVYLVTHPGAESDGAFVEMEFTLPPGSVAPVPHVHPNQVEDYEVLEGRFEVVVDGVARTLAVGEHASVPVGALHTFHNRAGTTVRVRNRHTPALRFEDFIESIFRTLQAAGVTSKLDPRVPLCLAVAWLDFPETLVPGRRRERLPIQALAPIGRRVLVSRPA